MLPAALRQTLVAAAHAMRAARGDWWVIGSAAVALHGGAPISATDVDIVLGEDDVRRVVAGLRIAPIEAAEDPLFRSAIFARWTVPPLAVELMAGFAVRSDVGWEPVRLRTREAVLVDGATLYVPGRAELHSLLERFGRSKDLKRAALIATEREP